MPVVKYGTQKIDAAPLPDRGRQQEQTPNLLQGTRQAAPDAASLGAPLVQGFKAGADVAFAIHADEVRKQDDIRVQSAEAALSKWELDTIYDPKNGALAKTGVDAFGLPDEVSGSYDKAVSDLKDALGNTRQKEAFDRAILNRKFSVMSRVNGHVMGQMQAVGAQSTKAYIENSRSLAVQNANDPQRVSAEIANQRVHAALDADRLGLDAEATKAYVNSVTSDTHVAIIDQLLAQGDDRSARNYFENVKAELGAPELTKATETLDRVEKSLRVGEVRGRSQRMADAIQSGYVDGMIERGNIDAFNRPTLKNADGSVSTTSSISIEEDGKEILIPTVVNGRRISQQDAIDRYHRTGEHLGKFTTPEAADAYAESLHDRQARTLDGGSSEPTLQDQMREAAKIQDPDVRAQVEERLKGAWSVKKQQEHDDMEAHATALKASVDSIMKNALNRIDATKVLDMSISPSDWQQLDEAHRTALRSYVKQVNDRGKVDTDLGLYYKLLRASSADPATQKDFVNTDLTKYIHRLDEGDFKHLAEVQASLQKGDLAKADDLLSDYRSAEGIISDTLRIAGIDPTPKDGSPEATVIGQFHQDVADAVKRRELATGKKASKDEIQGIVDGFIIKGTIKTPGWFWGTNDTAKRAFELKPGEALTVGGVSIPRETLISIVSALHTAGKPITDANIAAMATVASQKKEFRMKGVR